MPKNKARYSRERNERFASHRTDAVAALEAARMKLDAKARGVYVIAPTPFHPDGAIDESIPSTA